jgi:hypothetical protein
MGSGYSKEETGALESRIFEKQKEDMKTYSQILSSI